jgi:hypothetical protein
LLITLPVLVILSAASEGAGEPVTLQTVDDQALASVGISLRDPGPIRAAVGEAEVHEIAQDLHMGDVEEVKLAYVSDESGGSKLNRAVWVIRTSWKGGLNCIGCGGDLEQGWTLSDDDDGFVITFLDPDSGKFVSSVMRGPAMKPPQDVPPGWSWTGFDEEGDRPPPTR